MKRNQGFTLMELLIVIGVLGILAAGLLAAIDPFEQLKKARDSNYRSAAIELLSATQRYFANHGEFPWSNGSECETTFNGSGKGLWPDALSSSSALLVKLTGGNDLGDFAPCLQALIDDGELKSTFAQGLATSIYFSTWGKTNVRVCYAPEGKSNRSDKSTNMNVNGLTFASLVSSAGLKSGCDVTMRDSGECVQCYY